MVHIHATHTHLPTATCRLGNFHIKIFLQANFCIIQLSLLKLWNNNQFSTVIVYRILLHVSLMWLHVFSENKKILKYGILWACGSETIFRDGPKTRWQLQSIYKHLHGKTSKLPNRRLWFSPKKSCFTDLQTKTLASLAWSYSMPKKAARNSKYHCNASSNHYTRCWCVDYKLRACFEH